MPTETLRFWCKPRLYVLPDDGDPFDGEVEGLRLYEDCEPADEEGAPDDAVDYRIYAEKEVGSKGGARRAKSSLLHLAPELDRLWTYVTGEPLFFLSTSLQEVVAPDHWDTNYRDVTKSLSQTGGGIDFVANNRSTWKQFTLYPLERVLSLRPTYHEAGEHLERLIELHYEALTTAGLHARLLVYAKAVELVDAMVEGSKAEKEKHLPDDTADDLRHRFKWLWKICNGRIDTRHVVTHDGELHPELSSEERRDFLHDADLVIRDVVCTRFSTETVRVQRV